jgi:flagellar biosynthesis GTPase FlhF
MKMKHYQAPDMRQALQQVREAQGPDAVILSSRRINGGVEVVAAVDYDADDSLVDTYGREAEVVDARGARELATQPRDAGLDLRRLRHRLRTGPRRALEGQLLIRRSTTICLPPMPCAPRPTSPRQ